MIPPDFSPKRIIPVEIRAPNGSVFRPDKQQRYYDDQGLEMREEICEAILAGNVPSDYTVTYPDLSGMVDRESVYGDDFGADQKPTRLPLTRNSRLEADIGHNDDNGIW